MARSTVRRVDRMRTLAFDGGRWRGSESALARSRDRGESLERGTGLEPATFYLEGRRSTTELLPREGHQHTPALAMTAMLSASSAEVYAGAQWVCDRSRKRPDVG